MTPAHKLPTGIEPQWLWLATRTKELLLTITRYVDADELVSVEWMTELQELIKYHNMNVKKDKD
jgi:hypothetical protein